MAKKHSLAKGGVAASLILSTATFGCAPMEVPNSHSMVTQPASKEGPVSPDSLDDPKMGDTIIPPLSPEDAPPPSPRLEIEENLLEALKHVGTYYDENAGRRLYVQVDKPLYQPGETVWIRSWDLKAADPNPEGVQFNHTFELVSPKGAVVIRKRVQLQKGVLTNDFEIPESVQGGEYKIRVRSDDGKTAERPIIVNTYEPPRFKKKLEFIAKAYGPGDEVTATIEVKAPTGEALANHPLNGVIILDGQELPRVKVTTSEEGGAVIRFTLPETIAMGDGILTILVEEGGVTESITKRIPILVDKVSLAFFPEGGDLVTGLESRVYFEAKNPLGKPADIKGRILDDKGKEVGTFSSHRDGMGRFAFTPEAGRRYEAKVDSPSGVKGRYFLPDAKGSGCVLRTFDDLDGALPDLRVQVSCTYEREVTVLGMQREKVLDKARVKAGPDAPAIVHLTPEDMTLARAQGVARVTVFDDNLNPLAERLVVRNRRNQMRVEIETDKPSYSPRDQVNLTIKALDLKGSPVDAHLALSVVDDTVLSYADDKEGHMLSALLLEPELGSKVEEPNYYFDLTEEKGALGLDLVMGSKGYRRFEWKPLFTYESRPEVVVQTLGGFGGVKRAMPRGARNEVAMMAAPPGAMMEGAPEALMAEPPKPVPAAPMAMAAPAEPEQVPQAPVAEKVVAKREKRDMKANDAFMAKEMLADALADEEVLAEPDFMRQDRAASMAADKDWAGAEAKKMAAPQAHYAPVRVFPAPAYEGTFTGVRSDFRETIHWAPNVHTGEDGEASVSFYVSDAVTSFRITTEGAGGGMIGRDETVFESSLPFNLSAKLPVEVSAGDRILLPLSLENRTEGAINVDLEATFGELLTPEGPLSVADAPLGAGERRGVFFPLSVTGIMGESEVRVSAGATGLTDEIIRQVKVVPKGFPIETSRAGTLTEAKVYETTLDLGDAIPGSAEGVLKLYPSPLSTLISGLEGMLREPTGCFEQTSSSNYPNVMVMTYLKEQGIDDPSLLEKSGALLDKGYQRLIGYESPKEGFEWFGGDPGHEALTAYGLLEFKDMQAVYPGVDDTMMKRTANWLMTRRDGKGGYKTNPRALDSFGRAAPEVTAAYITYSLTQAGFTDIKPEIDAQAKMAETTQDPYLLALATNTLFNVKTLNSKAKAALGRLIKLQAKDGSFPGADHSITRSGGQNLTIETTALAAMAMIKGQEQGAPLMDAMKYLVGNRGGYGQWGATQATVLALQAMTEYAKASRVADHPGTVTVFVNGELVGKRSYKAGHRDPLLFEDIGNYLKPGANSVKVELKGEGELPLSLGLTHRSALPADSEGAAIKVVTTLDKDTIPMGETTRLTATVTNMTSDGQPMTMARVGIPGGLSTMTWQLKELREKGLIAFYETRPREVILYFRDMKPEEVKTIPIDLTATIPGTFTGPASQSYLYYTDDLRRWAAGLEVEVTP